MVTTIHIKNMVCQRCRRVVHEDLTSLGLDVVDVDLGAAILNHTEPLPLPAIRDVLQKAGFDVLEDKTEALVESVKTLIINSVYAQSLSNKPLKMSEYIEQATGKDYRYVSTQFSNVVGITIEKFLIAQRIERVKELLIYDEMPLTEIAYTLGYSSTAYLSNQFKQETGQTPTAFKNNARAARTEIDTIGSEQVRPAKQSS